MNPDPTPAAEIRDLERSYTERVNMAVAEDRYDLVNELTASYDAELSELQRRRLSPQLIERGARTRAGTAHKALEGGNPIGFPPSSVRGGNAVFSRPNAAAELPQAADVPRPRGIGDVRRAFGSR